MPTSNGQTLGDDVSLVIRTPAGELNIAITHFKATPQYEEILSWPIGQDELTAYRYRRYTGTFKFDRTDSQVDVLFAAMEAADRAGNPLAPGYIQQTIKERNGGITQWKYLKVAFKLEDAGDYSSGKKVEGTIGFAATGKIQVQ